MKDTYVMFGIFYIVLAIVLIISMIIIVRKHMKNKYNNALKMLERDKNLIISASILSELNKVESLINNKELEKKYETWKSKFKNIKDKEVPKITDEIINIEELIKTRKYKEKERVLKFFFSKPVKCSAILVALSPLIISCLELYINNKFPKNFLVWLIITVILVVGCCFFMFFKAPNSYCTFERLEFDKIYDNQTQQK